MNGFLLVMAAATMGIDAGWKPADGGGLEYIIQLKPHELATLANGDNLFSDIPSDLKRVRYYRIQVGDGALPHENELIEEEPAGEEPAAEEPVAEESAEAEAGDEPTDESSAEQSANGDDAADENADHNGDVGDDAEPDAARRPQWKLRDDRDSIDDRNDALAARDSGSPPPEHLAADPRSRPLVNHADYRGQRRLASRQGVKPRADDEIFPEPVDDDVDESAADEYDEDDQEANGRTTVGKKSSGKQKSAARDVPEQWGPLTLALLALFISLGGNAYLAWLAWAFRERYRDVLERVRSQRRREPAMAGRD